MADASDAEPASPQAPAVAVIDVSKFADYLKRVILPLLEEADDAPENFAAALCDRVNVECMKRFLGDPQIPALLVERTSVKGA